MSSCMKYRVQSEEFGEGYTITNGRLDSQLEETEMEIGSRDYLPIIITSYKGETSMEIYERRSVELLPMEIWKDAVRGKSTGNWLLTYITVNPTSVGFDFGYKDNSNERCSVTVYGTRGMEIWLEVPRDDDLTPAKYLIDTYYDESVEDNYHVAVTEFYDRMKRKISVVHESDEDVIEYLIITEYRE